MRIPAVALALALAFVSQSHAASFVPLGYLPDGFASSQASGISADGLVVVGSATNSAGQVEPFRWTASEGMVGLGFLPGHPFPAGGANGVSADGKVVVGQSFSLQNGQFANEGFRWSQETGMVGLGDLPNGSFFSGGNAASGDGSIVVGFGTGSSSTVPSRWTAGEGIQPLEPSVSAGAASDITPDGLLIVGTKDATFVESSVGFRWSQQTGFVTLADLPGGLNKSVVSAVSDNGVVSVGYGTTASRSEAVRWVNNTGPFSLGDLPGGSPANTILSQAFAVSADGSKIVGKSALPGTGSAAFIWNEQDGMQKVSEVLASLDVDIFGWQLIEARGISADGTVVTGFGFNSSGQPQAWLASLAVPEPSGVAMAGFMGLVYYCKLRRLRGRRAEQE